MAGGAAGGPLRENSLSPKMPANRDHGGRRRPGKTATQTQTAKDMGGDNGSHDGSSTTSSSTHHLARPRPTAQVSFRLRRPERERVVVDPRLSHSAPVCDLEPTPAAERPRNRRRLFRDMSYTNRAVRRDMDGLNHRANGPRGPLFSIGQQGGDRDHRRDDDDGCGPSFRGSDGGGRAEDDVGVLGGGARQQPRRQDDFRGRHRKGGGGRPGSRGSARSSIGSFLRDRSRRGSSRDGGGGTQAAASGGGRAPSVDQYHIPPPEETQSSILDACARLYSLAFGDVAMWVYGASFGKVLVFFLVLYMIFVYCFAAVLFLVDWYHTGRDCIHVPEEGGPTMKSHIEFAFELSWTTFTTVGYGNVGPPPDVGCYPIRLICSTEAILGMAFVSMCSGLFYAKLLRLLGRAPVTFSSTLCVQYGEGLESGKSSLTDDAKFYARLTDDGGEEEKSLQERRRRSVCEGTFHPFPVIEFRIVNNRANHAPGKNEIWDAEVTAIVQLSLENDPHENSEGLDGFQLNRSSRWFPPSASKLSDDVDNKSQQVFYKLALKPSFHPYFSRVWFLRHTLDDTSPLLRRDVRKAIRDRCDGWDPSLNNYQDIRECLVEFSSLQIIMSGASALSRSEVYAEKTYSYEDVCVGWRYIAVCYEKDPAKRRRLRMCKRLKKKHISYGDDAATRVDLSLIHDIVPQRGNDFEPVDD